MFEFLLISIYTVFILYTTLFPFNAHHLSLSYFLTHLKFNLYVLFNFTAVRVSKTDIIANFILFVMLGILCGIFLSSRRFGIKTFLGFIFTSCYGFILSVFIELFQRNIPQRVSSPVDVIVDTSSAAIGFLIIIFLKATGAVDAVGGWARRLLKENPLKLIWYLAGVVIYLNALYPFSFSPDLRDIINQIKAFHAEPFLLKIDMSEKFFWRGIIYFSWGILTVAASLRERGPFFLRIIKKSFLGFLIVAAAEISQIFTLYHTPSLNDIGVHVFWLFLGILTFAPLVKGYSVKTSTMEERKIRPEIELILWALFFLTLLLIFFNGLTPFDFIQNKHLIKRRLANIDWIPFKYYIKSFSIFTPGEFFEKVISYFALGIETSLLIKMRFAFLRFIPVFSMVIACFISGTIEIIQILTPNRVPSITDIIIAATAGFLGALTIRLTHSFGVYYHNRGSQRERI